MQFTLPSNLQAELLAYDPKRKALAQTTKKSASKKPKFPLGKIPCLIPTDVVSEEDQTTAIESINQVTAVDRVKSFSRSQVDPDTGETKRHTYAVLYHYEQTWYAVWLPPAEKQDEYVFGHAYAIKDTEAASRTSPLWRTRDKCEQVELGRGSMLYLFSRNVTREDLMNSEDYKYSNAWTPANIYQQKGHNIRIPLRRFEDTLSAMIPTWKDTPSLFDRIRCKDIFDTLDLDSTFMKYVDRTAGLTVENIVSAKIQYSSEMPYYFGPSCKKIKHIISSPAMRRLLQEELNRTTVAYNNPDTDKRKTISQGYNTFNKILVAIGWIHSIWPDCPIDHYQTNIQVLKSIEFEYFERFGRPLTVEWLRQHMPVESFFKMAQKHLENNNHNLFRHDNECYGFSRHYFSEFRDTLSMITQVREAGKELAPPKRWRITDLHDHVQAEAWKISNPKVALHQDLFPQPIKVKRQSETWTFFQPIDTHQLGAWGQAVRNCVGSASHYAEDIKKRKHFIVLCMIDGKPTFTIQLKVSDGQMSVIQVAGVANRALDSCQREAYSEAFKEALTLREEELKSS